MTRRSRFACCAVALCAAPAFADHQVICHGEVQFSNISTGPLVGVASGTPVQLRFVVEHTPNVLVPNEINEYALNLAETGLIVGAQTLRVGAGTTPPVLLFQNDNAADDGSDGLETDPDVIVLAGTNYQLRFHAHNILGSMFTSADLSANAGTYQVDQIHHLTWTVYNGIEGMLVGLSSFDVIPGPVPCDSIDFNGDTLFPDTQDISDFLAVFAGGDCPTGSCGDIDFNNDELFPDVADIESLLRVFAGGQCAV